MSAQDSSSTQDAVDLAALGRNWTPPPEAPDTSPEVSNVIAQMPWWAARGLVYIITSFVVAALLWASLSRVDVTVEARGAVVPEGYVRPVQAAGGGVVQHVFVREGERVERGQPVAQLDAAELRARLAKLREEIATSREQLRRLLSTGPVAQTLEQQNRIARLESERATIETSLRQTTILAPVSGLITTLEVRSPGAVVQAGQTLASIAPAAAPLLVETRVPNKDIALIETGLPVKLKFDAFPYQDYGTIEGRITYVSPDAETDEQANSFYKVNIAPEQSAIQAGNKNIPLRPGLAVTADIITERKSILSLLVEPFRKLKGEIAG
ncbi:MAG TPA: HlyD family efflux transporter periplasmic adaptor subunit [Pyrinomonadaceae bacterium]|jgi:multidrug efflux pump subunit AcrA (membrane-fusion protein)